MVCWASAHGAGPGWGVGFGVGFVVGFGVGFGAAVVGVTEVRVRAPLTLPTKVRVLGGSPG